MFQQNYCAHSNYPGGFISITILLCLVSFLSKTERSSWRLVLKTNDNFQIFHFWMNPIIIDEIYVRKEHNEATPTTLTRNRISEDQ